MDGKFHLRVWVALPSWPELEVGVVGESSIFSSLSRGSSGMDVGSSSLRAPLSPIWPSRLGLLRQPAGPPGQGEATRKHKNTNTTGR